MFPFSVIPRIKCGASPRKLVPYLIGGGNPFPGRKFGPHLIYHKSSHYYYDRRLDFLGGYCYNEDKIDIVVNRLERVESRFDTMESKFNTQLAKIENRFDTMESKC